MMYKLTLSLSFALQKSIMNTFCTHSVRRASCDLHHVAIKLAELLKNKNDSTLMSDTCEIFWQQQGNCFH